MSGNGEAEEAGEDQLLNQHVRGIVFAGAGQSLLDTVFTHDSPVSLFVLLFYICFCCLFNLLLVDFGVKIKDHYLHEQERASPMHVLLM